MRTKILAVTTALVSSVLLSACGGGDDAATPAAPTLSGTAAVGTPIVGGNVKVVCAGGSALSTTTGSGGLWQVTTSGQTLPCAVQVSGGTVGGSANATPYHSLAINFGTVNITPLTDLVIANLTGKAPNAWFTGISTATLQEIKEATLNAALGRVNTALGLTNTLNGKNPLTTSFTAANGNLIDDILEAIARASANANLTYANLLALAANANFNAPAGFNFSTAYAAVTGSNPGTGNPGTGTHGNLVVQVDITGLPSFTIPGGNVPAPSSQSEFCDDIANTPIFKQIEASGGGTLTLNSCSYANKVGKLKATLAITAPIPMTLPYSVTYTYQ